MKRLLDAKDAAEKIIRLVEPLDLEGYLERELHQYSVDWLFMILGEALNAAVREDPNLVEAIPDSRGAIGLRNRIIHGYDTIDDSVLWVTAKTQVPLLLDQINRVLEDVENGSDR